MSPYPTKRRFCSRFIKECFYKPQGVPLKTIEIEFLNADELEAMRLCDVEDLDQEKAAERMGVSRGTVQRMLYSGRKKVANALIKCKAIRVSLPEYISYAPTPSQGMGFGGGFGRRFRGGGE